MATIRIQNIYFNEYPYNLPEVLQLLGYTNFTKGPIHAIHHFNLVFKVILVDFNAQQTFVLRNLYKKLWSLIIKPLCFGINQDLRLLIFG